MGGGLQNTETQGLSTGIDARRCSILQTLRETLLIFHLSPLGTTALSQKPASAGAMIQIKSNHLHFWLRKKVFYLYNTFGKKYAK